MSLDVSSPSPSSAGPVVPGTPRSTASVVARILEKRYSMSLSGPSTPQGVGPASPQCASPISAEQTMRAVLGLELSGDRLDLAGSALFPTESDDSDSDSSDEDARSTFINKKAGAGQQQQHRRSKSNQPLAHSRLAKMSASHDLLSATVSTTYDTALARIPNAQRVPSRLGTRPRE
jgi:hypothetical protein